MKRLLTTLLVLGAIIVAVGFYRGWFTVNREQIRSDEQKAEAELKKGTNKAKQEVDKVDTGATK